MLLWVKAHRLCPVPSNVTLGHITPSLSCPIPCHFKSNHTVSALSLPMLLISQITTVSALSLPMLLRVKSHRLSPVPSHVTLGQITTPLSCPFQRYFGSNHTVSVLYLPMLLSVKSHRLCPVRSIVTLGQTTPFD